MSTKTMSSTTANTGQGVLAFVGITLGAIPLAQLALRGRTGSVWSWLLGDGPGSLSWIGPVAVLGLTVALIAVLELRKRRIAGPDRDQTGR